MFKTNKQTFLYTRYNDFVKRNYIGMKQLNELICKTTRNSNTNCDAKEAKGPLLHIDCIRALSGQTYASTYIY